MSATTTEINVPFPEAERLELRILIGACRLTIKPGQPGGAWVAGTYHDPTGNLPCKVTQDGGRVRISQEPQWRDVPNIKHGTPEFQLTLGSARPYRLALETGASEGTCDLGGLPLERLSIKQGAAKTRVDFSAPNPQPMDKLDLDAGASGLELRGLANANAAALKLDGGAATYLLDFDGRLQRDLDARITAGVATLELRVPASTAARITADTTLGTTDAGDGFLRKDGAYLTEAAIQGATPQITIKASLALGVLRLRSTPRRLPQS